MGIYQKNLSDAATHAVSIGTVATLRAPGASAAGIPVGQFTDTTANIAAGAQTVTAFASGGTFLGSASNTQNKQWGAYYTIETDGTGAITNVRVVQTRPDGLNQGSAPGAPANPGAGPNMAAATQTIIFTASDLNTAFGQTDITGTLEIALAGTDLQAPTSGADAGTNAVYDAEPGYSGFGLYVGGTGDIKLEFAAAPPNQTVTIQSIPAGSTLDMLVRKVYTNDSATTATEMVALY